MVRIYVTWISCSSVVTNYNSAHDRNASITIDQHWNNVEETALESLDKDSIWYVYM